MNDEQAGERLESWKKIAAYLRRDVRTVQRWEQINGLPIHRHQRAQRPIPYAYTHELDAWWKRQSQSPDSAAQLATPLDATPSRPRLIFYTAVVLLAIAGAIGAAALLQSRGLWPSASPKSVAVLPFVDLSEGMANEEFADGISEEVIIRLNRIPGMRVPAPASYIDKYQQKPAEEIGRLLNIAYVLDGSVRKSGERVRVAARLIRVGDASVVWSQTYDRPWTDMLAMQDDVAGEIAGAITAIVTSKTSP